MTSGYCDYLIYRCVERRLVAIQIAIMGSGHAIEKVRSVFHVVRSLRSLVTNYYGVSRSELNPRAYFPNGEPYPETHILYSTEVEFTPDANGELGKQKRLITFAVDEDLNDPEQWQSFAVTHRGTGFNPPLARGDPCTNFKVVVTYLFEGVEPPTQYDVANGTIQTASTMYASFT